MSAIEQTVDPSVLLSRYDVVRADTEALAAPLSPEDQTVQSMPDTSPTKWHRAHVTWFFETFVLAEHEPGFTPFHDGYWFLFNSYYESVGPRYARPMRGVISRPGAAEVGEYRANVDQRVHRLLERVDQRTLERIAPVLELGLNHEQQHQELLLMDIKHLLSLNPLHPAYQPHTVGSHDPGPMGWQEFPGGSVQVGHTGDGFCFDNELPRHGELLQPYRLADRLVTNGEWMQFIDDGGYRTPTLWLSDGWATVSAKQWQAPFYWTQQDGTWYEHTLTGTRPVDPNLPVCHVSHYEADAFAAWAGHRLPTEAEWEHAASGQPSEPSPAERSWHPRSAPAGAGGLRQLYSDCWQWTSSAYLPYPRFRAAEGAIGEYNGKFMSGQMVLRGGCALTPPGHTRLTYRNFFPPAAQWPMTGVRLAADA